MLSPNDQQMYVFAMSFVAAIFVAAMVRLWLVRREEERLLKNKEALEKQIVIQQKDLMTVRQDANAWRTEMQRQFDLFRHMASDQLGVEEKRFNELLSKTRQRELELQTALDIAKQMCAELPVAKARIMFLESLGTSTSPVAPAPAPSPSKPDSDSDGGLPVKPLPVTPMPDLGGGGLSVPPPAPAPEPAPAPAPIPAPALFVPAPPPPAFKPAPKPIPAPVPEPEPEAALVSTPAPAPVIEEEKLNELEQKLVEAEKKNARLQQSLLTMRLRSRTKSGSLKKVTKRLERA